MQERIKALRKTLGLTQQNFAERIGVKRQTVAQYEIGRNIPTDMAINLICREFSVDETWLRTGEGEMFRARTQSEELASFFGRLLTLDDADIQSRFVTALSHVGPEGWAALEKFIDDLTEQKKETDS